MLQSIVSVGTTKAILNANAQLYQNGVIFHYNIFAHIYIYDTSVYDMCMTTQPVSCQLMKTHGLKRPDLLYYIYVA